MEKYITQNGLEATLQALKPLLGSNGGGDSAADSETVKALQQQLEALASLFESMFEVVTLSDGSQAIHAKLGLYSDGFITAMR